MKKLEQSVWDPGTPTPLQTYHIKLKFILKMIMECYGRAPVEEQIDYMFKGEAGHV